MDEKECAKCKKKHPPTLEFFSACKQTKDKLQSWCRVCVREANQDRLKNPFNRNEHNKRSRERMKDRYATDLAFRQKDNERSRETGRVKRGDPVYRETQNQKGRERRANPEYKEKEREKQRERSQTEHYKSIRRAASHRRRAKIKGAEGTHTAADIDLQYRSQNGKCWHCGIELNGKFHVDHLTPLDRGGTNWPNNLVCSCAKCNQTKGRKLTHEWNGKLL